MHTFYFINAEQALKWSTEVMRKAQFPKISPIYKELLLTRHAAELKYIVSLLLEHRGREAIRHWNRLELEPALRQLSLVADSLTIETQDGDKFTVPIDALLADLQKMIGTKTSATTAPAGDF